MEREKVYTANKKECNFVPIELVAFFTLQPKHLGFICFLPPFLVPFLSLLSGRAAAVGAFSPLTSG